MPGVSCISATNYSKVLDFTEEPNGSLNECHTGQCNWEFVEEYTSLCGDE